MAVPKRKMSRSNTRNRRSQWKAKLTELTTVRVQGREISVPRRLEPLPSKQIARVRFPSPAL